MPLALDPSRGTHVSTNAELDGLSALDEIHRARLLTLLIGEWVFAGLP
jgi:hypothetical protein